MRHIYTPKKFSNRPRQCGKTQLESNRIEELTKDELDANRFFWNHIVARQNLGLKIFIRDKYPHNISSMYAEKYSYILIMNIITQI